MTRQNLIHHVSKLFANKVTYMIWGYPLKDLVVKILDYVDSQAYTGTNIQVSENTVVNGYQVPKLTPEQVTKAYNATVKGNQVTITDATEKYHLVVNQADILQEGISISLMFYHVMVLTYIVEGNEVVIEYSAFGG